MKRGAYLVILTLILIILLINFVSAGLIDKATITVTAEGCYGGCISGYKPGYANDSNLNTYWLSDEGMPTWISFEFSDVKNINKLKIQGNSQFVRGLINYTIQTSNDGVTWNNIVKIRKLVVVWNCTDVEISNPDVNLLCGRPEPYGGWEELTFSNAFSAKFVRIWIDSVHTPEGYYYGLVVEADFYTPETTPSCQNECSPLGKKECVENSWKQCGNYDDDPCLEWSSLTPCAAPTSRCNTATGNCVQCLTNADCSAGQTCQNNQCITSPTCTDTDNSIHNSQTGTLTLTTKNTPGRATDNTGTKKDNCVDINYIGEAFCYNNIAYNYNYAFNSYNYCEANGHCYDPSGEEQGQEAKCVANVCSKTGKTVTSNENKKDDTIQETTKTDKCLSNSRGEIYSCDTNTNKIKTNYVYCAIDEICTETTDSVSCVSKQCDDSDAYDEQGREIPLTTTGQARIRGIINNQFKDNCPENVPTPSYYVIEYYCLYGNPTTINLPCGTGYGCQKNEDGVAACIPNTCTGPLLSEIDISVKGTVSAPNWAEEKSDRCYNNNYVIQVYCDSQGLGRETQATPCGSGKRCEEGRCISNNCIDPDVSDAKPERRATSVRFNNVDYADECISLNYVKEYICGADSAIPTTVFCGAGYECPRGQGACIKTCRENECSYNNKCYSMGIKVETNKYCDITGEVKNAKIGGETCLNNFECSSNQCSDGKCVGRGFMQTLVNVVCFILHPFNEENRETCRQNLLYGEEAREPTEFEEYLAD